MKRINLQKALILRDRGCNNNEIAVGLKLTQRSVGISLALYDKSKRSTIKDPRFIRCPRCEIGVEEKGLCKWCTKETNMVE